MAGAAQQGLFGPGVDDIRLAIAQQGQQQDMAYAQMPMGRGPVALMAGAGRNLGNAVNGITGNVDPRIAKAQAMQEAAQEVDGAGFSLLDDPQAYYKATYKALMARGLTQEAAHVRDIALQETATNADINLKNAQAKKALGDEFGAAKNGTIYNKSTGAVVREGTPTDPKSQIVSLYPPNTARKGEAVPKTFDMSNPDKKAEALRLMSEGWIDDNALPGPEGKGTTVTIEDKRGLQNTGWLQDVTKDEIKRSLSMGSNADRTIADATTANELLISGKAPAGFGAQAITTLSRAAERLGVSEDVLSRWNANPSDSTALQAVHNQMIASLSSSLGNGGKVSAREIQLAAEAGPEIWQTEKGQYFLNNYIIAKAQYDKKLADKYTQVFSTSENAENPMKGMQEINKWKEENQFRLTATMYDDFQRAYKDAKLLKNLPDAVSSWKAGKLKTINQKVKYKGQLGYYWGDTIDPVSGKSYPDIRTEPKR